MRNAFTYLLLFFSLPLGAQEYPLLVDAEGEIPVADLRRTAENTFDVARAPGTHFGFTSAVLTGNSPREILAAYIRTDTARRIELTRSPDGGRTWIPEPPLENDWDAVPYRSLSLFNLGRPYVRTDRGDRRANVSNNLILFSGGSPVVISASYTDGRYWSQFYAANRFGGFRVSGVTRLRDGRYMALFHDDGRFLFDGGRTPELRRSVIYKIYSSDGGLTWSEPQIALKHNLHGLYDAAILPSPNRGDDRLILVCSERETRTAYLAFSDNGGTTWSYPESLPPFLQGDRFALARAGERLLIAFRDMRPTLADGAANPTFGDLVLWSGDVHELLRGRRRGIKVRVGDNFPVDSPLDPGDLRASDVGYPSILPLGGGEIAVVAYGRWEADEPPFVRSFRLNPRDIRAAVQEQISRRTAQ